MTRMPDPDDKSYFWDGAGYAMRWGATGTGGTARRTQAQLEARRKKRKRRRQRISEARAAEQRAQLAGPDRIP